MAWQHGWGCIMNTAALTDLTQVMSPGRVEHRKELIAKTESWQFHVDSLRRNHEELRSEMMPPAAFVQMLRETSATSCLDANPVDRCIRDTGLGLRFEGLLGRFGAEADEYREYRLSVWVI